MRRVGIVLAALLVVCGPGCTHDDGDASVDPGPACERLVDLAETVLGARDASSLEAVADAVGPSSRAFVRAAKASGDDRLAELGRTYEAKLDIYLSDRTLDGREAGDDADISMDRAMLRCTELGFTGDFPQEP